MNKRCLFSFAVSVVLTGAPLLVDAAQVAPNPNPFGSTIDIISDPSASNNQNPYLNLGTINIDSASTLTNTGTLTNAGTLAEPGILNNAGTLNNVSGGTLTNDIGGRLNNTGTLISTGTLTNAFFLTNAGTLTATNLENDGIMTNATGGTMTATSTLTNRFALTSDGTLTASNMLNLYAVANNGTMTTSNSLSNYGTVSNTGTWSNSGSVHNFLLAGISNTVGATLTNSGGIYVGELAALYNNGTLVNSGTLISISDVNNTGTLINTGTLTNTATSYPIVTTGVLTNNSVLINAGTLTSTGAITGMGTYLQTAGQTTNDGTMTQTSVAITGGALRGTGTITSNVTIGSGALLSPGDATTLGKFNIHGNLQSSGSLLFRIEGLSVGQFDVLDISGDASFTGGTVSFSFSSFDPKIGNSWDFLYASAISGWDSLTFLFSGLDSTERAQFHFRDGVQTLRIVAVPEPSSMLLLVAGLASLAILRRGKSVTPAPRRRYETY